VDNITHSLVGIAMAEAVVRFRELRGNPQPEPMRRLLWAAALFGANLPDADTFYSFLTEGRLGYLLHHRGHTHTLIGLIPQFLLIWWALRVWVKRSKQAVTGADWAWMLSLVAAGELSHIGLDALNWYGVHPLWPFDNRWFYGDVLFILEPWLWMTLIPALYFAATAKLTRTLLILTFTAGAVLALVSGYMPWFCALPLVGSGIGLWNLTKRLTPGLRFLVTAFAALLPVLGFACASHSLKADLASRLGEQKDLALTPSPGNPFCWSVLAVESYDGGKAYRIRSGVVALFPSLVPAARCSVARGEERTATWLATDPSGYEGLLWFGEIRNTVDNLKKLAAEHCHVAAFLRFARVPYFQEAGQDILMGDLRFDRQRGLGFAEIQTLRVPLRCPEYVPNWTPPFLR
jgi:inner membrane protein